MKLENLIERIKEKPILFIGERSVSKLAAFIRGYVMAANEYIQKEDGVDNNYGKLLRQYRDWLAVRYSEWSSLGWEKILLQIAINEEDSLSLFWDTWEEFLADPNRDENAAKLYAWMYEK